MTYALRGCHDALLACSKHALASSSQLTAGGNRWLLMAPRGHAPVVRRPASRWSGAVKRPSVFQAGHISSWHRSCEVVRCCCCHRCYQRTQLVSSTLPPRRLAMCEAAAFFRQLDGAALVLVEAAGVIPVDSQSGNAVQRSYCVPGASACRFAVEVNSGYPRISSAWSFIGNSEQAAESVSVHDSSLRHLLTLMQ